MCRDVVGLTSCSLKMIMQVWCCFYCFACISCNVLLGLLFISFLLIKPQEITKIKKLIKVALLCETFPLPDLDQLFCGTLYPSMTKQPVLPHSIKVAIFFTFIYSIRHYYLLLSVDY